MYNTLKKNSMENEYDLASILNLVASNYVLNNVANLVKC